MREGSGKASWLAWALALALVLALAGSMSACGGASSETSTIDLRSPGVTAAGTTRPNVHCGWGAIWLPLEWGALPDGTKELAIFIEHFKVQTGKTPKIAIPYADLVTQLSPSLRQIGANVFPDGAGASQIGVFSCRRKTPGMRSLVELFALDRRRTERKLTRPLAIELTEEALAESESGESPRAPGPLTDDAAAVGRILTTYPGPHSE